MRSRYSTLSATLTVTMLVGSTASGQVVELSGGASTLYDAQGGTVTIHGDRMETSFGAGFVQHRLAAGGSSTRQISGGSLTAGQQELRLDLPTDVFEEDHLLFGTGLGVREQLKDGSRLTLFGGSTAEEGGTPLFDTDAPQGGAVFADWRMQMSSRCTVESMGLLTRAGSSFTNSSTLLGGAACAIAPGVRFALTSGIGAGSGYSAASVEIKQRRFELKAAYIDAGSRFVRYGGDIPTPEATRGNIAAELHLSRTLSLSGLHRNYLTPGSVADGQSAAAGPMRSSLDQLSLESHGRNGGWQVSFLHSTASQPGSSSAAAWRGGNLALTAGETRTFGRLQWNENWLCARENGAASTSLLVSGLSWSVNPHLTLTESANLNGAIKPDNVTFSHGGTWLTSFSSISVSYQLLYLANRPDRPFQQTMVFDAGTRLFRGLSVHASSSVGPTGTVLYTFQLGKTLARNREAVQTLAPGDLGAYALRGRVVDAAGDPVEGAVLMIGSERVYTGSEGEFLFRERRGRTHPFRVLPEEFLTLERYVVISAPVDISTRKDGPAITVVVARQENSQTAAARVTPVAMHASEGDARQ